MSRVFISAGQLDFHFTDLNYMPPPEHALMVDPAYFSVDYTINPHMKNNEGTVDKIRARHEWETLKHTFEKTGIATHIVDGQKNLPDMVFSANQSLPFIDEARQKQVCMSIMHAPQRKPEVPFIEQWYRQNGYKIHHLDEQIISDFEGCGDAIWHHGKRLLWGGYGYRSSVDAYQQISALFDVPVIALKLTDENFYHLDTCFCVLDETTVLIYPHAFTDKGLQLIEAIFEQVLHANETEARDLFACNASCPDGQHVIIQEGCTDVNKKLREAGFTVYEVDTGEFLKSGGSVFCMKQMVW